MNADTSAAPPQAASLFWTRTGTWGLILWCPLVLVSMAPDRHLTRIDLLMILGPMVVVPLGLGLLVHYYPERRHQPMALAVRGLYLFSIVCLLISVFIPRGTPAMLLASVWLGFSLLLCATELIAGMAGRSWSPERVLGCAAQIFLAFGALWVTEYRAGSSHVGFPDIIVGLTGIHFHFISYSLCVQLLLYLKAFKSADEQQAHRRLSILSLIAVGLVPIVAVGIAWSKWVESMAAILLSVIVLACGLIAHMHVRRVARTTAARILLSLSNLSILTAMVLSLLYASRRFTGVPIISISDMIWTHGFLNAAGYSVLGLLGWLWESKNHRAHSS